MAKLVAEKYRRVSNGELGISAYHVTIKKELAEASGLIGLENLKITVKNGKIIIEKGE